MTICDIAKMAGVSVATVSRVINNKGYVKEGTRKKIEQLIEETGYRPNAVARSLVRSDTSIIAVIMSNRMRPFFSDILDVIQMKAEESDYSILLYNTGENEEKEQKAIAQAIEYQVKGILLFPIIGSGIKSAMLLKEAESKGISVVLMDRKVEHGNFDIVTIDNKSVIYDGIKLFIESGHKKIGFIACPEIVPGGGGRINGYLQCLQDYGIPVNQSYIRKGEFDEESGYNACASLLSLPEPPTALLAACSSETIGCIRYLNEHQIVPGKNIGLIGFDDIALLYHFGYQKITSIERPVREMGEIAYEIMEKRMKGDGTKKQRTEIMIPTRLIIKGTEKLDQQEEN